MPKGTKNSRPRPAPVDPLDAVVRGEPITALRLLWDTLRYAAQAVEEDNVLFLASGIAFNILLAIVPFVLLLASGLSFALNMTPDASTAEVRGLVENLLPPHSETSNIHELIDDVISTRGSVGLWSSLAYLWLSTRLFGSMRTVLSTVFDRPGDRGVISGKWFDVQMAAAATFLMVGWVAVSLYLAVASSASVEYLESLGIGGAVMGAAQYWFGRLIAFTFIALLFYAMYRVLPKQRVSPRQALLGALCSGFLFEIARSVWTVVTRTVDPGSLYSGTLYAVVSVVFWVYYAALIFLVGAVVSQAHQLVRHGSKQPIAGSH